MPGISRTSLRDLKLLDFVGSGAVINPIIGSVLDGTYTGGTPIPWNGDPSQYIAEGDSITQGYNLASPSTEAYPAQLQASLGTLNYLVRNVAVSGERTGQMLSEAATELDGNYDATTYAYNFCSLLAGANDAGNVDLATVQGYHQSWHQGRVAKGFLSIAMTCTPQANRQDYINDLNAFIRANWRSWGCVALVDFGADSYFDLTDSTKTTDQLHWTAKVYTYMAAKIRTTLLPLLYARSLPTDGANTPPVGGGGGGGGGTTPTFVPLVIASSSVTFTEDTNTHTYRGDGRLVFDQQPAANEAFEWRVDMFDVTSGIRGVVFGMGITDAIEAYQDFLIMAYGNDDYVGAPYESSNATSSVSSADRKVAQNDVVRYIRLANSADIFFDVSRDGGTTWKTLHSFVGKSAAKLYLKVTMGAGAGHVNNPRLMRGATTGLATLS